MERRKLRARPVEPSQSKLPRAPFTTLRCSTRMPAASGSVVIFALSTRAPVG